MTQHDARRQLVEFLERKAFRPVLRADEADFPEARRSKLRDVQESTRKEIERFHHYRSAEEVVTNFRRDLTSEPAKKVHRALKDLGLPTLEDVREEFEKLAERVGQR